MSKPKRRQHAYSTDGLTVKTKTGKKRGFAYQIPPEVADLLPAHATMKIVSFTRAEIFDLASQVEPHIIQLLAERPAKNPLEALLFLVQGIYALLQPPEMPIPHKDMLEISNTLAFGYSFSPTWPYTLAHMQAAMTSGHPDLRPDIPEEQVLLVAEASRETAPRSVKRRERGIARRHAIRDADGDDDPQNGLRRISHLWRRSSRDVSHCSCARGFLYLQSSMALSRPGESSSLYAIWLATSLNTRLASPKM
jgi:hypothetical protein